MEPTAVSKFLNDGWNESDLQPTLRDWLKAIAGDLPEATEMASLSEDARPQLSLKAAEALYVVTGQSTAVWQRLKTRLIPEAVKPEYATVLQGAIEFMPIVANELKNKAELSLQAELAEDAKRIAASLKDSLQIGETVAPAQAKALLQGALKSYSDILPQLAPHLQKAFNATSLPNGFGLALEEMLREEAIAKLDEHKNALLNPETKIHQAILEAYPRVSKPPTHGVPAL